MKKRSLSALRDIARLQGVPFSNSTSHDELAVNIVMHRATLPLSPSSSDSSSSSSNNSRSISSSGKPKPIPTTIKLSSVDQKRVNKASKKMEFLQSRPLNVLRTMARAPGRETKSMSRDQLTMFIMLNELGLPPSNSPSTKSIPMTVKQSNSIPTTVKQSTKSVSSSGKKTKNTATSKRTTSTTSSSNVSSGSKRKPAPKRAKPASTW